MATVVDVLARLRADSSGMTKGFGEAERAAKGFSTKAVAIGSAIGTALGQVATQAAFAAGRAITGFVGDSVNAARDINETISKVGVIFGDQAGAIQNFANSAATNLGLSKQAAMDAASTFAVFGKSAGLAGGDLTTFSTDLTGLSADLASFYNTSPEEAITAIGAALRGESEPIRRYGVLLDDASLRQKALEMGIVSTTKTALTPQQRVLAAQALILKQTGDAQGDFARTSGGLANQQRILSAQVENVKTVFGQALLPVVLKVTTAFTSKLLPVIQQGAEWIQQNLTPALETITSKIGSFFSGIGGGSNVLKIYVQYLKDIGNAFMTTVMPAIQDALPKFQTLFQSISGALIPVFKAFVGFMSSSVVPTIMKVVAAVVEIAGMLAEKLAPVVAKVGQFFANKLIPALQEMFKKAQPVIDTIIEMAKNLAKIAATIISVVAPIILKIAGILINILKPAFSVVITIIGAVLKVIGGLIKAVANIGTAFNAVKNVAITAFNLMMSGIGLVVNRIIDIFNGLIRAWNLVPFHDDVDYISHVTMPQLAKSVAKVGTESRTAAGHLADLSRSAELTKDAQAKVASSVTATSAATATNTTATNTNTSATEKNAAAKKKAAEEHKKAAEKIRQANIDAAKGALDAYRSLGSLNKAGSDLFSYLAKGMMQAAQNGEAASIVKDAMAKFGDLISTYASTITDEAARAKFELEGARIFDFLEIDLSGFQSQLDAVDAQRAALSQSIQEATQALADAKQARAEGAAALKDIMTAAFGEPSQLRAALSGAEATVSSIISTYNALREAINKRFAGIDSTMKDEVLNFLEAETVKLTDIARQRQELAKQISAAEQALADALQARGQGKATIKDILKSAFGEPSQLRSTLSSAQASVSSIISTYDTLVDAIEKRFAGIDPAKKDTLLTFLKQQTEKLTGLARAREGVIKRIEEGQKQLADVLGEKSAYQKSIADGIRAYGLSLQGLVDKETKIADPKKLVDSFKKRLETLRKFTTQVKALAAAGLDRSLIEQIIGLGAEEGTVLAEGIAAGGAAMVAELNGFQSEISVLADEFGDTLADKYFNVAVQQVSSYVAGLQSQQANIQAQMDVITTSIETQLGMLVDDSYFLGSDTAQQFVDGLKAKDAALATQMLAITTGIEGKLRLLADSMAVLGTDAAQKFLDGLKAKEAELIAYASELARKIVSIIQTALNSLAAAAARANGNNAWADKTAADAAAAKAAADAAAKAAADAAAAAAAKAAAAAAANAMSAEAALIAATIAAAEAAAAEAEAAAAEAAAAVAATTGDYGNTNNDNSVSVESGAVTVNIYGGTSGTDTDATAAALQEAIERAILQAAADAARARRTTTFAI